MPYQNERRPQVILRVADLARSLAFYRQLPQFSVAAEGPEWARVVGPGGVPLILASARADLAAWPQVPQAGPAAWVYLRRPDLPALARELAERGLPAQGLVEPYPGYRHMLLPDPDGYLIAFWEPLPASDAEVLELYGSAPARLRAALEGLDENGLNVLRAPGKWSLRQIVHHIVDSDLGTFQVLRLALGQPGYEIQPHLYDGARWNQLLRTDRRPIGPAVALFAAAREWILDALEHVPGGLEHEVSWPGGHHAAVRELLRQAGTHTMHHILQIEEIRRTRGL